MTYDINEVAAIIDWPVEDWPGNCYAVACAMLERGALKEEHEDAKKRYGHWLGPVDPKAPKFGDRKTPFQRHGWLEVGTTIIDPTRWVFENKKPYIYVGKNRGKYDVGGNRIRMAIMGPPPPYDMSAPRAKTAIWSVCGEAHRFVMDRLLGGSLGLTKAQEMWVANADPAILGRHAKPIYQAIIKAGLPGLIPIDNRRLILEDE